MMEIIESQIALWVSKLIFLAKGRIISINHIFSYAIKYVY